MPIVRADNKIGNESRAVAPSQMRNIPEIIYFSLFSIKRSTEDGIIMIEAYKYKNIWSFPFDPFIYEYWV